MTTTITGPEGEPTKSPTSPERLSFGQKFVGLSRVDILRKTKKKESTQKE
jgi:hypothetical protein